MKKVVLTIVVLISTTHLFSAGQRPINPVGNNELVQLDEQQRADIAKIEQAILLLNDSQELVSLCLYLKNQIKSGEVLVGKKQECMEKIRQMHNGNIQNVIIALNLLVNEVLPDFLKVPQNN